MRYRRGVAIMNKKKDTTSGKKILDMVKMEKVRDLGVEKEKLGKTTDEMRIQAANALGEMLQEHGEKIIPMKWNVYNLSLLHTLVSMGMLHAAGRSEEQLMKVAGIFRQGIFDIWLKLGMKYQDCEILNQDIIVITPKNKT